MALDPQMDPSVAAQLYGAPQPSLANETPWSWVPANWNDFDEQGFHGAMAGQQQIGPGAPGAVGAPPELAAPAPPVEQAPPAPAPAAPTPVLAAPDAPAAPAAPPLTPEAQVQMPFAAPPPITELPSARPATPDALSGGGDTQGALGAAPTRMPDQLPEAQYREATKKLGESPFDPATGDIRADVSDEDAQRYMNDLASRDPAKFAEVSTKLSDIKTKRTLAEHARIADEDWKREQANLNARAEAMKVAQAKSAAIEADAQRIADTKIDPSGGMSGGQRIAGVLGAIVGGLVQSRTGSQRNAGMDALHEIINRGIETQKMNLANQREGITGRRSALAEEYARTNDAFHAQEAVRLASLKHADDLLATEQMKYSPRGTSFQKIAALRAQVGAAQAEARQKNAQTAFDNSLKQSKQALDEAELREKAQNNRAVNALGYAQLNSQAADRALQRQIHTSDKADAAAAKAQEQHDKQVLERSFGGEVTKDASGNQSLGPLTMADGSVFVAKGPEGHVNALRKKHDATVTLTRTLDEIRRVGPEWLSDTANSDKFQRLNQLMGDAKLQAIAAKDLGVPTGHDIELAENFLGTSDATRRKDSVAGLIQARASLVRDHNVELQHAGLDKPWDPQDLSTLPGEPAKFGDTAIEAGRKAEPGFATKRLLFTDPKDLVRDAENAPGTGPTGLAAKDTEQVVSTVKAASGAAPADRAALVDRLAAMAQSPRESVANGVLGLIRGESPALYNEVVAKLPADRREALPDFDALPLPGRKAPPATAPRKSAPEPVWNGTDWVLPEGK